MANDSALLVTTELTDLIERLDGIEKDAREAIAESRRLRAANRRLLKQIQTEPGLNREE